MTKLPTHKKHIMVSDAESSVFICGNVCYEISGVIIGKLPDEFLENMKKDPKAYNYTAKIRAAIIPGGPELLESEEEPKPTPRDVVVGKRRGRPPKAVEA